jgi:hypothetical protein
MSRYQIRAREGMLYEKIRPSSWFREKTAKSGGETGGKFQAGRKRTQ